MRGDFTYGMEVTGEFNDETLTLRVTERFYKHVICYLLDD